MFQPELEAMSRDKLVALQSERLVKLVEYVYSRVPHYRAKMDKIGIKPGDIKSVEDLKKLPFTYKTDLRDTYPFGLFAADMKDIIRIHASSGTTGKQTVVGYTAHDIDMWADLLARAFTNIGATKESIIQVSYGYGLFTGGLGAHYGVERLGAAVVPTSTGNTARQIQTMVDFGVTNIACTPSYMLYLAEEIIAKGLKDKIKLKSGIFGAEPWTEEMRREIEDKLGIKAYDIYGLSEVMGPGVSCECACQSGLHVQEDMFIAEIIDPVTEEVLPYGEKGEIVFTTLTKEGLPLIRYRTKDITFLTIEPCACGSSFARMAKPSGRSDDMLIIRGVNVFPSQIEGVLLGIGKTAPHYMIIVDRKNNLDTLEIQVELSEEGFSDSVKYVEQLTKQIGAAMQSTLGISAKITLVEPKTIARSEGKAKRVIDKRSLS